MENAILETFEMLQTGSASGCVRLTDLRAVAYSHYKIDASTVDDWVLLRLKRAELKQMNFGGSIYLYF